MTKKKEATNHNLELDLAVLTEKVDNIGKVVTDIKGKLERNYATKEWVSSEYSQTKKIVNGLIWVVLVEVVGAVLFVILK